MAQSNPALSSLIVGNVLLYYKDTNEAMTYNVAVSNLMSDGEEVDPATVEVTVAPNDTSIDFSYMADATSITVYLDEGGTPQETYEFTIKFDSTLSNSYVDYFRTNIKQVYKQC